MRIVFSCGDVNGIGLEIFYKYFKNNVKTENEFAIVCNEKTLFEYFQKLDVDFEIKNTSLLINDNLIRIVDCDIYSEVEFGKISSECGKLAIESIEKASLLCKSKEYDAVVTLPIQKESMYLADWEFTGHTEFYNKNYQKSNTQMMLFSGNLRVVPLTIHVPLKDVSSLLSIDNIVNNLVELNDSLKLNFNIDNAKIAVLGLNPHAGENGSFGDEEIKIIQPAIDRVRKLGVDVSGPFPADGFFGFGEFKNYDGILSMYHDQGLIPLKLFAEGGGVNFTSGLEIIRTSPDHGTAMAIAGKNKASEKSLKESIESAFEIVNNRNKYD